MPAVPVSIAPSRVWVVCRSLGVASEEWLYRQIRAFARVEPEVVCWQVENPDVHPLDRIPVHVLAFDPFPEQRASRWWLRLRNLPRANFFGSVGAEARELDALLQHRRPDVILCHYGHFALRVLPLAQRAGVPVVAHFHGVDISACLSNPWYRWSLQQQIRNFAALVVVAEYQREYLLQLGAKPDQIHLIPCGVPVNDIAPAVDPGLQPCRFLAVGRLVEKKGPLETVAAFATCAREVPDSELTFIGDGPLLEPTRQRCRALGVADRVHFLGSQPARVVMEELRRACVFVQHSVTSRLGDKEGWPVSIAEAMAAGLPVIATRHAGIEQQVVEGETGYLVEERDSARMAERMIELATQPERRVGLGRRGRQVAQQAFDQRRLVQQLETVLLTAIGETALEAAPAAALPTRLRVAR
jgi:colanic acid/amylovoran biosynthesis glycosyltransferase